MLLLGITCGTFELTDILAGKVDVSASPYYRWILGLILLVAYQKCTISIALLASSCDGRSDARFRVFAFSNDGKSGYLLMARLWPCLQVPRNGSTSFAALGSSPCALPAVVAFFRDDLKSI